MFPYRAPVLVLDAGTKRESGNKARASNFAAAKAIAEIVRTCLGPRALLKMIIDRVRHFSLIYS